MVIMPFKYKTKHDWSRGDDKTIKGEEPQLKMLLDVSTSTFYKMNLSVRNSREGMMRLTAYVKPLLQNLITAHWKYSFNIEGKANPSMQ